MSKQAVDIIEEYLNSIVLKQPILSATVTTGQTVLEVGKLYHLRKAMSVYVDGIECKVYNVDNSTNEITIQEELLSPLELKIPNPFYFHGTPQSTNVLLGKIKDFRKKSPLFYLYELLKDEKNMVPGAMVDREITVICFVLDNAKGEWNTDEHYEKNRGVCGV